MQSSKDQALAERDILTSWLFEKALPLWSSTGCDAAGGGFFETIDVGGCPSTAVRRTRVVGRQIYSFATAARLGWTGPGLEMVRHGVEYLFRHCIRPDGLVNSTSEPSQGAVKEDFDLYDHAFALFGMAAAARIGVESDRLSALALKMLAAMRQGFGHPVAGFEEASPRVLPLKANPHMHCFEASLAWDEATPGTAVWRGLADEIGELCLAKFLASETGALREFFDGNWNAMPGEAGRIVEPGHQFEWSWLLVRWGRPEAQSAAQRLTSVGEEHGVDPQRGLAISEIWDDLSLKDGRARLWQQTERIKAWLAMAEIAGSEEAEALALSKVAAAAAGLRIYFDHPVPGACWENVLEDGQVAKSDEARASSLYHIVCAISEMHRCL